MWKKNSAEDRLSEPRTYQSSLAQPSTTEPDSCLSTESSTEGGSEREKEREKMCGGEGGGSGRGQGWNPFQQSCIPQCHVKRNASYSAERHEKCHNIVTPINTSTVPFEAYSAKRKMPEARRKIEYGKKHTHTSLPPPHRTGTPNTPPSPLRCETRPATKISYVHTCATLHEDFHSKLKTPPQSVMSLQRATLRQKQPRRQRRLHK